MSSQGRHGGREERKRFQAQSSRQAWIPRGYSSNVFNNSTPVNPQPNVNAGASNSSSGPPETPESMHRGNQAPSNVNTNSNSNAGASHSSSGPEESRHRGNHSVAPPESRHRGNNAPRNLNTNSNSNAGASNSSSGPPESRPRGNHSFVPPESTHRGNNAPRNVNSNFNSNAGASNSSFGPPEIMHRGNHSFDPPESRHRGNNAPRNVNSNFNSNAGASNSSFGPPEARHRGNHSFAPPESRHRGNHAPRGHTGRPTYQRKERERTDKVETRDEKNANIPQLVQEIQEKLTKGTVECMICYDMVRRSAPIWSCSSCYSIFHLNCIKKWARAPTSVDLSAEKNQGFNWRCPGCQSVQLTSSKEIRYICFCSKRVDPPSDLYLTPHSCGEHCGKPLEREVQGAGMNKEDLCPHICVLQCHPGPCPPCKSFAPPRMCPCGKKKITTRCSDRRAVLTCGQCCNKPLDCGRHRCERVCHVGPCDECQVMVNASCFCKRKSEMVLCGEMTLKGEVKAEDGVFACVSTCGKKLTCGHHGCSQTCHPGPCEDCSLMPIKIRTCHCGKTSLQQERQSCLDPIPICQQICEKSLPCGAHRCQEMCHAGTCPPCIDQVTQKCRCGSTSRSIECYITTSGEYTFTCEKPCGRKKNCGRHRCNERCCPLYDPKDLPSGDWDPHLCSMACGKKLRCGQHFCESLCHSGHCPPCLETIFSDLTCACGRTSIPPPLPCGTPLPSCQLPCSVPQPCGHHSSHSCHFGDCPPCSVPVAKECVGGHVILRNIPCGSKDIRCNKLCGKTRQCGLHACGRTCHAPPCDNSSGSEPGLRAACGQTCGAPRRECRHTCTAPCHPSAPCPDVRCDVSVTIACSCGRLTTTVPCDAGGSNSGFNADTVYEASIANKLLVPLQPVEATGKKIPLGQRKLMCDDDCAKLERKRVLADAFDITPPNLDALHFGDASTVSEVVADLLRRDPKWVLSVEERCKFLVLGKNRGTNPSGLKVHVFCPMLKEKRDAVRLIAERWKLVVSSAGWEPKRFVMAHVTPKSKAPARILGVKGATAVNAAHPPTFDPLVDMDPRLVVSFLDLPREADISGLVLRFGGECELVWLNDKNALAVFSDPARAATAMRRLEHGSVYHGVAVFSAAPGASSGSNVWGGIGPAKEGGSVPWKKAVINDPEEWSGGSPDVQASSVWKTMEGPPITTSLNRWSILDGAEDQRKHVGSSSISMVENEANPSNKRQNEGDSSERETSEVVDDWEKACE